MPRTILLHVQVLVGFDAVEEEVHFIDALIDMPMAAVPRFVVCRFFDGIEPAFGAIIHGALINAGKECSVLFRQRAARPPTNRSHVPNGRLYPRCMLRR